MIPYMTKELGVSPGCTLAVINIIFLSLWEALKFVIVTMSIVFPKIKINNLPPEEVPIARLLRTLLFSF